MNVGVSGLIRHFPDQGIIVSLLSSMEDGAWEPMWKIHDMVVALIPDAYLGAIRIEPSSLMTSPLSISFSMM